MCKIYCIKCYINYFPSYVKMIASFLCNIFFLSLFIVLSISEKFYSGIKKNRNNIYSVSKFLSIICIYSNVCKVTFRFINHNHYLWNAIAALSSLLSNRDVLWINCDVVFIDGALGLIEGDVIFMYVDVVQINCDVI
jgi:hypothetical protein